MAGALRRICDEREGWEEGIVELIAASPYGRARGAEGFAGMVQFFADQQQVATRLFAELPWRKLDIECTAREWEQYYGQMAAALEMGRTVSAACASATSAILSLDTSLLYTFHLAGAASWGSGITPSLATVTQSGW